MPATPEHTAQVHQLVEERLQAGKPVWDHTIDLTSVFHDTAAPFTDWRDSVIAILRASAWVKDTEDSSLLSQAMDGLTYARDLEEFNKWWDVVYDLADYDRVQITTR